MKAEVGDWVEVSYQMSEPNQVVKRLGQVQDVGDHDNGMTGWLLVKHLDETYWWNPMNCRKLSEHEVMERLTDV
jgi:hypothetical protein